MNASARGTAATLDDQKTATARRLAGLVGPTLIAIITSEVVNLDLVQRQYRSDSYLNGTVVFVAGLAIVHAHHRWTRGWPIVLTLTGWGALLWGLFRMFLPGAAQGGASAATFLGIAIPFADGVFLTSKAYWPHRRATSAR